LPHAIHRTIANDLPELLGARDRALLFQLRRRRR
jgi:hypothetical protein